MARRTREVEVIKAQNGNYTVVKQLAMGKFGSVYHVQSESGKDYAMKCESAKSKKPLLPQELQVLQALESVESPHLLRFIDKGLVPQKFLFLIVTMVGSDLQKLQSQQQGKRFALNTALRIGEQTLAAIRDMHRSGYIHKDISPSNFAIGIDPAHHTIFILDFGSAEKISDIKRLANRRIFAGNYKYASLSAFRLKPMSYKDDLESWWYVMVELIVGRLPWSPSDKTQKSPQAMIGKRMQMRTKSNLEKSHLIEMIKLIDLIQVNEVPDYDAIYDIIASAQKANGCNHEEALEWDPMHDYAGPPYQKGQQRPKGWE